ARGPLRHPHPPVLRVELVAAAAAALMVESQKDDAVLHELPAIRPHGHVLVWRGRRSILGGCRTSQREDHYCHEPRLIGGGRDERQRQALPPGTARSPIHLIHA